MDSQKKASKDSIDLFANESRLAYLDLLADVVDGTDDINWESLEIKPLSRATARVIYNTTDDEELQNPLDD